MTWLERGNCKQENTTLYYIISLCKGESYIFFLCVAFPYVHFSILSPKFKVMTHVMRANCFQLYTFSVLVVEINKNEREKVENLNRGYAHKTVFENISRFTQEVL